MFSRGRERVGGDRERGGGEDRQTERRTDSETERLRQPE